MDTKQRHIIFIKKRDEIQSIVDKFQIITKAQICSILKEYNELTDQIIQNLKHGDRVYEAKPEIYVAHPSFADRINEISYHEKVLWLLLDLREKLNFDDYVFINNRLIVATIIVNRSDMIDIVYCPWGEESNINKLMEAKERYLEPEVKAELHRIVLVDTPEQIKSINITGLEKFVIIEADGSAKYFDVPQK